MLKIIRFISCLVSNALLIMGCASVYNGPRPDFSKAGEAREQEIKKFEFENNWWGEGPGLYVMGSDGGLYTGESLLPIIRDVSPRAVQIEKTARYWTWVNLAILGASLIYMLSKDSHSSSDWWVFSGSLVVGAGFGQYGRYKHRQSIDQYNEDLKKRFDHQSITYNWKF